ncbi:MAG: hypothetical protein ACYTXY_43820, partial [Nostoc sp.]
SIDVNLAANSPSSLQPITSHGWSQRYNFDGIVKYSSIQPPTSSSYTQLFRNGAIEAVDARILTPRDDKKRIPSVYYEEKLIDSLQKYLELQKNLELNPPILIMLSLLGVKGYTMGVESSWLDQENPIDRDILIIPEIV